MNITLFAQLLQLVNRKQFYSAVKLYDTDKHNKIKELTAGRTLFQCYSYTWQKQTQLGK